MKTVRPGKPEPIPVHAGPHRMGRSVIVRFLVLAAIIAGIVLVAWLR